MSGSGWPRSVVKGVVGGDSLGLLAMNGISGHRSPVPLLAFCFPVRHALMRI